MFPANFKYHRVDSFAQAVAALQDLGPEAKLMAGGQTLIPMMKLRLLRPVYLVDLGRIADGGGVTINSHGVEIGALATHKSVGGSEAASLFPVIGDCALGIADAQERSMGTLGGSLAEADPCSCWPTLLMALQAEVKCLGPGGARQQTVRELLRDAYSPALNECELMTSIVIDRRHLEGHGAFVAFKRAAPAYPTASVALQLQITGNRVTQIGLALGCVGLTPLAVDGAFALLEGRELTAAAIDDVAALASETAEPFDDNKGTSAYKRSLVKGLVRRAFRITEQRRCGLPTEPTHTYYG